MDNLQQLANEYNNAQRIMDKIDIKAGYYEDVLLEYDGVVCYVDEMNLYHEYIVLRSNCEDLHRFEGNHKTIKLTLKEFDEEVTVLEEK